MIGTKLAHYEITSHLGSGGMGDVYQATDTTLGRSVALKFLPESFAHDADRIARFEREARVLASLNHPHIAAIYGLEIAKDKKFLVMELVSGETLAGRIARGAIPVEEAMAIAKQIAEALEAAHEKGIIHRDLKPANIKVTAEGKVKVLDFGLAKALSAANEANVAPSAAMSNSPTLSMAATNAGLILGTAAYMSPEQAKGRQADRRTDIFSFGCVLYEMLSGKQAFSGEDTAQILARLLERDPDWSLLPANLPASIHKLLRLCLQKDLRKRRSDAGDVRIDIEEASESSEDAPAPAVAPRRSAPLTIIALALGGALVAAFATWIWMRPAPTAPEPLVRLSVDLGPEAGRTGINSLLISPDGTRIVYVGRGATGVPLYTRRLDQSTATLLATTEVRNPAPFFSPDGEWIGFQSGGKIMKVSVQGGSAVKLGDYAGAAGVLGASWGDDGNIIIGSANGLWRMPGTGGVAQPLETASTGALVFPHVLPGSKAVLLSAAPGPGTSPTLDYFDLLVLELSTGKKKTLLQAATSPQYLPTAGARGHLVYTQGNTLFAVGFDPKRLEMLGSPTPILSDLAIGSGGGGYDFFGQFAFSNAGTFIYLSGKSTTQSGFPLLLLDAAGKTTPLLQSAIYGTPRFSPDGNLLAYIASGGMGFDVWIYDLKRRIPTQLTFQGKVNRELAWARDSKHVVYGSGDAMFWTRADGSGQAQLLLDKMGDPRPSSFAPDGRLLFSSSGNGLPDIWTLPVDLSDLEHPKPGKAEPFLMEPGIVEVDPAFSPDGKFIAYASNESSSANDIFVRPFPGPGGKWKVSVAGGKFPAWSPTTHELLFLGTDNRIMVAGYTTQGESFSAVIPRVWTPAPVRRIGVQQSFDVSPDGKYVAAFPAPAEEEAGGSLHATFLLNFVDELRRRAPLPR
jgi:serine/threonine-protein kinase